jgi:hypothetical protein
VRLRQKAGHTQRLRRDDPRLADARNHKSSSKQHGGRVGAL